MVFAAGFCFNKKQKPDNRWKSTDYRTLQCPRKDSNLHALRHTHLKRARLPIPPPGRLRSRLNYLFKMWAENGTRTRDPDLGKVVLYQLSYFRKGHWISCGERDRTTDLQVMSLASYHCSTPRYLRCVRDSNPWPPPWQGDILTNWTNAPNKYWSVRILTRQRHKHGW